MRGSIPDDEHEARPQASARDARAVLVQRAEGGAVAVETVGETPGIGELETGWDEEADFFGEGFGEVLVLEV